MKQSYIIRAYEVFPGSDTIRKYSFKTLYTRDSYALLARANHHLAMDFAVLRGDSAHFLNNDCFECLSPHISAA